MNQILTTSLTHKFILCLLTGLTGGATLLRILRAYFRFLMPEWGMMALAIGFLVMCAMGPFAMHKREQLSRPVSNFSFAKWQTALCYFISLDFALFGFQKLAHQQFFTPLGVLDTPFNEINNEMLTWAFFGRSRPLTYIIGIFQIMGSVLLIVPRTRLLGVIFIIPIILNILLIDIFYDLPIGIVFHVLIMTAGLGYLLFQYYEDLFDFFLRRTQNFSSPFASRAGKTALYVSVVGLPIVFISMFPRKSAHPEYVGKYEVQNLTVDGANMLLPGVCRDSVLTVVYLEIMDVAVFEYGSHRRRAMGTWKMNGDELVVDWFPPLHNTPVRANFKIKPNRQVLMNGMIGNQDVVAELIKIK
jgi:hypothetical protein